MNTAMQELIERLKYLSREHDDAGLRTAIQISEELLEKEKQQIQEAVKFGEGYFKTTAEDYYNETYKQP